MLSTVKQLVIRPNYSSPPASTQAILQLLVVYESIERRIGWYVLTDCLRLQRHGASVAEEVLTDPELLKEWQAELLTMAERIVTMRSMLRSELERIGAPRDWSHIEDQIGMFAFTGLNGAQVDSLREVERVYLTRDGRMSLAGLAGKHVPYVAAGMKRVTEEI